MACTDADFAFLRSIVFARSSNELDPARDYLFDSRLKRTWESAGLCSLDELVETLRRQPPDSPLKRAVAEAMTVNETSFFRDWRVFSLIEKELLPSLVQKRRVARRLRLWSAACATGQEAYSLAILIREHFPELSQWQVEITGTDISAEVVSRAQAGLYQRIEVNRGLPARYLIKYMQRTGEEWQVVPDLKRLCRFSRRNLCEWPLPAERYDGILLRNVMLYFPPPVRARLLLNLHRVLASDGFLILGSSEQPSMPEHFQPVLSQNACFYKPIASQSSSLPIAIPCESAARI
jgi:chemotaxis protein methyltransferase CheR